MPDEPKLVDELRQMEYEPLLPIEKKLIVGSLLLGLLLLVVFVIAGEFLPHGGGAVPTK